MGPIRPTSNRLVMLLLATSLVLIVVDHYDDDTFVGARRSALTVSEPIRSGLDGAAAPAVGAWRGALGYDRLLDQNEWLQSRIDELEGDEARRPDLQAELQRLSEATEIAFVDDVSTRTARVIVDRISPAGQVIEIDKGSGHGIQNGMPVVTGRGLIGSVAVVATGRSIIRPITTTDVTVGIRSFTDYGVVTGHGDAHRLGLKLDPRGSGGLNDGARVVTSGLERSLYPDNIPVGTVNRAADGELQIEPLVDFDELGYVTVLLWRRSDEPG